MRKAVLENLSPFYAIEAPTEEVVAIFELSEEDIDLIGGGPQVENDPNE